MNGTSAAAPTVAGVAALMLSANPQLTLRDVKYILATTAFQIDPDQPKARYNGTVIDPGWITNAAGHHFSNWYGFGLLDGAAAVERAMRFTALPAQQDTSWKVYDGKSSTIGGPGAATTPRTRLRGIPVGAPGRATAVGASDLAPIALFPHTRPLSCRAVVSALRSIRDGSVAAATASG